MPDFDISPYLKQIVLPKPGGTKGDNGRVLVIGGSELFHAASFWAASMASRLVDMVHFSSPAMENNDLMRVRAKEKYWDGIIVPYEEVEHYIVEDDCILIGPGMTRGEDTKNIVNSLLTKYPDKKWVVDGGALQEVDPTLLTSSMIITPNAKELQILSSYLPKIPSTILAKGPIDSITSPNTQPITISGGSPSMTKGGTGDVLAGLVAGLYAKSDAVTSCVVVSYINKASSEKLGSFFTPDNLISEVTININRLGSIKISVVI